jgi:solute carrier family 25 protein 16
MSPEVDKKGSSSSSSSNNKEYSTSAWQSMSQHFSGRTFISGGLAGSVAKTLVAPIDRVKILLQVHNVHYEGYGIFESFYQVVQKEGFLALYKGNGAQMLRIFPYAAMQFTSYETYKSLNKRIFQEKSDRLINSLACGSLAGITAVSVTYPLDVIRSRLAFQYRGEHVYSGIIDSIRKISLVSCSHPSPFPVPSPLP